MKNVISASRRTDIPAFYGDWFMNLVRDGAAGFINPFGGQRYTASLKPEDVVFIVFWSKNFGPFMKHLDELDALGHRFYFQFTITGHPKIFEENAPPAERAVEIARRLAERFSPEHVLWRFDPIIFSSATSPERMRENFAALAKSLAGATRRCYFSYVQHYGKVRRNFEALHKKYGTTFRAEPDEKKKASGGMLNGSAFGTPVSSAFVYDLTRDEKIAFARELARVAAGYGISLHTCCGDYLLDDGGSGGAPIFKAHCVDGELIARLTDGDAAALKIKPTRAECGCFESRDIGAYDTCPHGCHYCYANTNKELAAKNHESLAPRNDLFYLSPNSD